MSSRRFALASVLLCTLTLSACGDGQGTPDGGTPGDTVLSPDVVPPDVVRPPDVPAPPPDVPSDQPQLGVGTECDPDTSQCGTGLSCCRVCCTQPEVFTCMANDPDGTCPAPDLFVDEQALVDELAVYEASFVADSCEIEEGCIDAPGVRRILGFTTLTPNMGTMDLALGDPASAAGTNFVYSPCHQHYHFEHYAEYRLLDETGNQILVGRKQAFCLEDFEAYSEDAPNLGPSQLYTCQAGESQGIHRGWADRYYAGLPCQWLDVTDVPPGKYTLEMEVNPDRLLVEKDYTNNITRAPVVIGARGTPDPLVPCGASIAEEQRECGWVISGSFTCTPGESVAAGCNQAQACDLGACQGDPLMRICDGTGTACFLGDSIARSDDAPNCNGTGAAEPPDSCPFATFTCPTSGQFTVMTAPYAEGEDYRCDVATR